MRNRFNPEMFKYAVMGLIREANLSYGMFSEEKFVSDCRDGRFVMELLREPTVEEALRDFHAGKEPNEGVRRHIVQAMETKRIHVENAVKTIRTWLDDCDIVFSGSEVRFGYHEEATNRSLRIRVQWKQEAA